MSDSTETSYGCISHIRQATTEELEAESKLFSLLNSHAETYGLTVKVETWFDGTRTCAVAFLMADKHTGPYCVTAIVLTKRGNLREWPHDSKEGPMLGSKPFLEECMHEVVDNAIATYTG